MYLKRFLLILLIILAGLCAHNAKNNESVQLPPMTMQDSLLLLPLDSRPVCSTMVQKLARIAGINVIVPPKELLDNYQEPANSKKLWQWLQKESMTKKASIISADILLHGSLLQTRQHVATLSQQAEFFQELGLVPSGEKLYLFSVIPRLLVSDEVYPDCWYQWHLMRYSQLLDMVSINGDFAMTKELLEYKEEIPKEILEKYTSIFEQSESFNRKLLEVLSHTKAAKKALETGKSDDIGIFCTSKNSDVAYGNLSAASLAVIGQDDSNPFGLPHMTAAKIERQIQDQGLQARAQITYGADEIASLLLTRHYLQQTGFIPQIYLHYGTPKTEFKYMPYMATSVGATLRNQAQLLGAQLVNDSSKAHIIIFVHCGDDDSKARPAETQQLAHYLRKGKKVALVDLSANFEAEEMLLPLLLKHDVPINKLTAYAGWNTFSNSSGTAMAQACIFTGRLRELNGTGAGVKSLLNIQGSLPTSKDTRASDTSDLAALYAANLNFTAERMLEDYYYQKLIHPKLRSYLESFGTTPTDLVPEEKLETERYIHQRLSLYAVKLLWQNLMSTPFYGDAKHSYYLDDLTVGARLPWNRIFEVDLNVHSKVKRVPNH